jgi:hypothetical protein
MFTNKKSIVIVLIITIAAILFIILIYEVGLDKGSKNRIISLFENNSEKFILIQNYLEDNEGELFVDYDHGKLEINNLGGSNEILDEKVKKELLFIFKKLRFVSIGESGNYIRFEKEIGTYPKGVIYLKDDNTSNFIFEIQKIRDNWYYYMTKNV